MSKIPWLCSYGEYLKHHGTPRSEVVLSLHDAMRVIDKLPNLVKVAVIKELNSWGRDDFVEFSGYISALETVARARQGE